MFGIDGLKGKTGVVDIQSGGTAQLPLYFLQEKYGLQFWDEMEKQYHPTIFDSITPLTQRLASGNVAVALDAETTVPGDALAKGAPLQWVYPSPTVGVPQMLGVVAHAPHMAAAQLYLSWSLSKLGLAEWSSDNLLAPINDTTPDNRSFAKDPWFTNPKSSTYYDADWAKINTALPDLTTKFKSTFK
jgi:ABC-type Fe3+ transport system substrate-binding protein